MILKAHGWFFSLAGGGATGLFLLLLLLLLLSLLLLLLLLLRLLRDTPLVVGGRFAPLPAVIATLLLRRCSKERRHGLKSHRCDADGESGKPDLVGPYINSTCFGFHVGFAHIDLVIGAWDAQGCFPWGRHRYVHDLVVSAANADGGAGRGHHQSILINASDGTGERAKAAVRQCQGAALLAILAAGILIGFDL